MGSQKALRTFLHLAARIRPNGVLALTTLSSDVILDRRGIGENGSGRGRGELHEHGALVHRRLYWIWIDAETVKRASQNPDQFGLGYDFRWADGLRSEEYLVNSRLLKEKCQRPGLRLRVARSFKDWLQDKMACPSPKNQYRAIWHTFPEDDKKPWSSIERTCSRGTSPTVAALNHHCLPWRSISCGRDQPPA